MAKAKKSKAKKSKLKKAKAKKTKRATKRAAAASRGKAKASSVRKAKKASAKPAKPKATAPKATAPKAAAPKATAKKAAPAPKKKQIVGEGDYQASARFLKDQAGFVKRHAADIPAMAKDAEAAWEGPQGGVLRAAEEEAASHSKAPGE